MLCPLQLDNSIKSQIVENIRKSKQTPEEYKGILLVMIILIVLLLRWAGSLQEQPEGLSVV